MNRNPCFLASAFAAALLLFSSSPALAQNAKPPTQLTYQGFLTDANGVPFGNSAPVNKTIIFRIYDALTGGNLKWSSQQVITVDKGYFSALLGQGSAVGAEPFSADLTSVFTGNGASDRYLEINADGTTIAPRLRFLPSPYAMLAKSATELLDPVTGASSLSISGGNISVGGSIASANLNVGSTLTVNSINATGNITGDQLIANGSVASHNALSASAGVTSHGQGAYIEWNKDGGGGMSYFLNQKGGGGGGMVFGEVTTGNTITERMRINNVGAVTIGGSLSAASLSGDGANLSSLNASQITSGTLNNARTTATSGNTANTLVARDGSGNFSAGQVTANSFKLNNTQTLILYDIVRFGNYFTSSPVSGVTQSAVSNGDVTRRQTGQPGDWWKSTQTGWGTIAYQATYSVPSGEVWEVAYNCQFYCGTDDGVGIVWSLDDVATDDAVTSLPRLNQNPYLFNQTFILSSGNHTVRVKASIHDGSGTDHIYFPYYTPQHCVIKKYKSN